MAELRPFAALRPREDLVQEVAALPYDVMDSSEAREMVKGHPYSFLHIDKAEIDLPEDTDPHDPLVYKTARATLQRWTEEGVFLKEDRPCFYLYRLTMAGRSQTGLVAAASIDEYLNGRIKKHELTREEKEQDRICHVDACDANTGPIFLACRRAPKVQALLRDWQETHPVLYDFAAGDGVQHTVWKIDEDEAIEEIQAAFKEVPALYIADGHHRTASAVKVGLKRREQHPDYTGEEEFNRFLSVIFPEEELAIWDYNRVVRDLRGQSPEEFLGAIEDAFHPQPVKDREEAKPKEPHTFGLYLKGRWYRLQVLEDTLPKDSMARLDVSLLQERLLEPVLQIGDPRTDERIDFVGGIRGLAELERRVDSGEMAAAFALYPTAIGELMQIADEGRLMPPKSTWFEPKLRSGIFIHSLK